MAPVMSRQDSRQRAERAFQLRAVGRSWQEIADALNFRGRQSAQDAVRRLMASVAPESTEHARRCANEGLRITMSVLFETLTEARKDDDHQTVISAARAITDTIDKVARLGGLHVPVAAQVDVTVSASPQQIIAEARERLMAVVDAEIEPREIER